RIVSEDSLHRITSLSTVVHSFTESKNVGVVGVRDDWLRQDRSRAPEALEVISLRPHQRKALKERHDHGLDVGQSIDFPVPAAIAGLPHASAAERLVEEVERRSISLRHVEGR